MAFLYTGLMTKDHARLIAVEYHSGFSSAMYRFYRYGEIDKHGMNLEISEAMKYVNTAKSKKRLSSLRQYILMAR